MSLVNDLSLRAARLSLVLPTVVAGMGMFPGVALSQVTPRSPGCPAGTTRSAANFIFNGDYSLPVGTAPPFDTTVAGFTSDLPYRGDRLYPDDAGNLGPLGPNGPRGGISIQSGPVDYGVVSANPFPGDPARGVGATQTYLYSNPNASNAAPTTPESAFPDPTIWRQTVTVAPNTTYTFLAYFNNLLKEGILPGAVNPEIQLQVTTGGGPPIDLGPQISVPRTVPGAPGNEWLPVEFSFTTGPGVTSATLSIVDRANDIFGDDFGHTALGLNQCISNVGIAKAAGTPVNNGDGTFTVPYTLIVRNYGIDPITSLRVTDELTDTFAEATNFAVSDLSSPTLTVNPGFDGRGNPELLAGTDQLAAGAEAAIAFNVRITPGPGPNGFGPFANSAIATGTVGTETTTDISHTGANPDPDGDGNPNEPGENDPTVVTLPRVPRLGVAKQAGTVVSNTDGTFTIPYTITVQNFGNVAINQLQVTEILTETFGPPTTFAIEAPPTSPTLAVNSGFDGSGNAQLLAGTDTLAVGQSATITFNVRVTPNGQFGPFNNTAVGSGTDPGGSPVTDQSTDGTDPDPNNDGVPNENVPTTVTFPQAPSLGLAKQAGEIVSNQDGTFTVPYTITVQNFGNAPLSELQVVENLTTTFGPPTTFTVEAPPTSPTLTVNSGFDGRNNPNLLVGSDTLALGQVATITFSVRVTPNQQLGPFNNIAVGQSRAPDGTPVTDDSTDGTNPDPDGDGVPNENTPTQVTFTPLAGPGEPRLRLIKRITAATRAGVPVSGLNFNQSVTAGADDTAEGWAQLPTQEQANGIPRGLTAIASNNALASADEVEYTIYFLSDGGTPARGVTFCDPIPQGTTFVRDSFGASRGLLVNLAGTSAPRTNQVDADNGAFFSALAPLPEPEQAACPDPVNPTGAVTVRLGEVNNTPGSNFGFIRFRVRID